MSSVFRLILLAVVFLQSRPTVPTSDPKGPGPDPELTDADQLYRSGKFSDAESSYQALLKNNPTLVDAQVGLARSMLRQQKTDEAFEVVSNALASHPASALLLATKGDVQFRRGEMAGAETSYLTAKKTDPKEVRAYLGLARLYSSYSLYRKAYDQLQSAHLIAPDDLEVQRDWLGMLPRKERLEALKAYLAGPHPDDEEETQWMHEYLNLLDATVDKPAHACKLVSKVERTDTNLQPMLGDGRYVRGIGLDVTINDRNTHLQFDTGAGGIIVGRRIAEKAGLTRLTTRHYGGIGDKGLQSGYAAIADHIRIGQLEFRDCVVSVTDARSVTDEDGLIGADVFNSYLVDIDLPAMRLKLSPLPKRPEDAVAPNSLNSEGEEQANAERKEETNAEGAQKSSASSTSQPAPHLPKDRYVAPEMASWTKVFRFSHLVLVPTSVNSSHDMLFALDTGAFANTLSLRAARQMSKVSSEDWLHVKGVNGQVKQVYSAKAVLRFGHLQVPNMEIVTFDLSSLSRHIGTEVSGLLGFGMLRILEVKLDYRDGLVDLEYDPKRIPISAR
jgi:tetratricopeptide (TPR) repeat protein